jgi:hypothetical protein
MFNDAATEDAKTPAILLRDAKVSLSLVRRLMGPQAVIRELPGGEEILVEDAPGFAHRLALPLCGDLTALERATLRGLARIGVQVSPGVSGTGGREWQG